jgi:hypothetical protein
MPGAAIGVQVAQDGQLIVDVAQASGRIRALGATMYRRRRLRLS